ncbi:MAG: TRAP transporter small permease subunit [SAR324 cluster bacterium]|nr:TRAP transporter small permease subunit [SAR324 cluster bacterium]
MPKAIKIYVRYVEAVNRKIGKATMYLIFVMMGILLLSSFSRIAFNVPFNWTLEMSQFTMAAYYLLGGGYSMMLKGHVRMDLLYERWSPKRRAVTDLLTSFCLIFYLLILLYGAYSSTEYAIKYGETKHSAWAPYMWPIKLIMSFGIVLMLLQAIAEFFRDLAAARGESIT